MLIHMDKYRQPTAVLKGLHHCHSEGQTDITSNTIKDLNDRKSFYTPPEVLLGQLDS